MAHRSGTRIRLTDRRWTAPSPSARVIHTSLRRRVWMTGLPFRRVAEQSTSGCNAASPGWRAAGPSNRIVSTLLDPPPPEHRSAGGSRLVDRPMARSREPRKASRDLARFLRNRDQSLRRALRWPRGLGSVGSIKVLFRRSEGSRPLRVEAVVIRPLGYVVGPHTDHDAGGTGENTSQDRPPGTTYGRHPVAGGRGGAPSSWR